MKYLALRSRKSLLASSDDRRRSRRLKKARDGNAVAIHDRGSGNRGWSTGDGRHAGQSRASVLRKQRRGRTQSNLRRPRVNPPVRDVELLLEKLRPFLKRFLDGLFKGRRFGRFRRRGLVDGDDLDINEIWREWVPANRILQDLLILHLRCLRNNQVLLVRSQLRFRARHIQGSHRADLQLLLVVAIQSLRSSDSLLLDLNVGSSEHQLPIRINCA